jgi:serine protease Do
VNPRGWPHACALALFATAVACGHAQTAPRSRLTPKEIVQTSKPAIVRVEVGADRVGTGFVIDKSGLVATNFHVVVAADDIRVTMLDGAKYPVVRVIGFDADHDLALLDIDPPAAIPTLALGDSEAASAGDPVLAIGNPLGVLDYTVSDGLLSAVREVAPNLVLLQITAPISQGSSGGPLFNSYGEVIGIVNAFLGGGQNLNFAIPAKYLKNLAATTEPPLSLADFKAKTVALLEAAAKAESGGGNVTGDPDADVKIVRKIPNHPLSLLDGCPKDDLAKLADAIGNAIRLGAPLYNEGVREGVDAKTAKEAFERCYLIYEGVVRQYEQTMPCQGVRTALGDGLVRAETVRTAKEKAWVMRDTFDGLVDVIVRSAHASGTTP